VRREHSDSIKRRGVYLPAGGSEYSRKFVLGTRLRSANCANITGSGPTWCTGKTDADSSADDEG